VSRRGGGYTGKYHLAGWGIAGTYQETMIDAERLARQRRDRGEKEPHACVTVLRDDGTVAARVRVWPS
jgi:hypothetical protein